MKSSLYCVVLTLAVTGLSLIQEPAQKKAAEQEPGQVQMIELPKATKEHKAIFEDLGTWEGDMTMYMGPEPIKTKCIENNHKLGPFWMISNFHYELGGQKMRGHGQFSYNAKTGKYHGTWIDNSKDTVSMMVGERDEETKTTTYTMTDKDPEGNDVNLQVKTVMHDKDTKDFTMSIQTPDKKWQPIMTVNFKRVKMEKKSSDQMGKMLDKLNGK